MNSFILGAAIILIILIIFYYTLGYELLTTGIENIQKHPFIKLYQSFNEQNLIFEFKPLLENPAAQVYKEMVRGVIKSVDLNLPKKNDGLDDLRKIELWSVNGGNNISSSETPFYNPYLAASFAMKANPGLYKLIVKVNAGSRIRINLTFPVNKTFIYARM